MLASMVKSSTLRLPAWWISYVFRNEVAMSWRVYGLGHQLCVFPGGGFPLQYVLMSTCDVTIFQSCYYLSHFIPSSLMPFGSIRVNL